MRSIILIASLVFTLVSGCLPCSQLLQRISSVKSCCTKSGSCKIPKQPTPRNCSLTIRATEHALVPDAPEVTPALHATVFEASVAAVNVIIPPSSLPAEYSPPDLFLLNSTILI